MSDFVEIQGNVDKAAVEASAESGYALWPVHLSAEEIHDFYLRRGALLVNPYYIEAVADGIKRACELDVAERRARMRRMRRSIQEYDIFWWVESFMHAAFTRDLSSFPLSPVVAAQQQAYLHA